MDPPSNIVINIMLSFVNCSKNIPVTPCKVRIAKKEHKRQDFKGKITYLAALGTSDYSQDMNLSERIHGKFPKTPAKYHTNFNKVYALMI